MKPLSTVEVEYISQCPECRGRLILDDKHAEVVCSECSLVVADSQVLPGRDRPGGDEKPYYGREAGDDASRTPQRYFSPRDSGGKPIRGNVVRVLRRTAQTYSLRSYERNMLSMEARIRRLSSHLGLPHDITERSVYLFRQSKKEQVIRRPGLNDWALALLLASCREFGRVMPIDDLIQNHPAVDPLSWKDKQRHKSNIFHYNTLVCRGLSLKPLRSSVKDYIVYFAGKVGVNGLAIGRAVEVSQKNVRMNAAPHCVAAASLFISLKEHGNLLSQNRYCREIVHISEISLRTWMSELGKDRLDTPLRGAGEVLSSEIMRDLPPERDNQGSNGKQGPDEGGPIPSAPKQTERDGERSDDGKNDQKRKHGRQSRRKPGANA